MCSDPSTVFRCLFHPAHYPAPLSPFFPTSLCIFYDLAAASLSHLNSPSPHLTLLTLENRRPFFSPAESSAASRETAYGAVLSTRQAVHPATSRLTRSRVQPIWFSSLSLHFHILGVVSSLRSACSIHRLCCFASCRAQLSSIRLLCARTSHPHISV